MYSEKQRRVSTFMKTPRELEKVNIVYMQEMNLLWARDGTCMSHSLLAKAMLCMMHHNVCVILYRGCNNLINQMAAYIIILGLLISPRLEACQYKRVEKHSSVCHCSGERPMQSLTLWSEICHNHHMVIHNFRVNSSTCIQPVPFCLDLGMIIIIYPKLVLTQYQRWLRWMFLHGDDSRRLTKLIVVHFLTGET